MNQEPSSHTTSMESLYQERLRRYQTAMRNEKPDRIPIRPFVADFVAKYAGYTVQQVTHDYRFALDATRKCAAEFDWDATVGNMVYVWTGLTQAIGLKYYATPGVDISANTGFQYKEPSDAESWMCEDEYDELIRDPTQYLYTRWYPRVSSDVAATDAPNSYRTMLSCVKGGMAMMQYFGDLGVQNERLRRESGTAPAIGGILKAPFDIIADKLRGYRNLCMDLFRQPKKVLEACEAMAPHLLKVAMMSAGPGREVPLGLWMHRGCTPFLSPKQFEKYYWPSLKWVIEELHRNGYQTLFYAEGEWNGNLKYIAELPDLSIVYHVDRGDIFDVHRAIGHKFCISGGIPNDLLALGTPDDVRAFCKKVIDGVARDGGYIMDASAIMQDDTKVENLRAMTDFTREYGVY